MLIKSLSFFLSFLFFFFLTWSSVLIRSQNPLSYFKLILALATKPLFIFYCLLSAKDNSMLLGFGLCFVYSHGMGEMWKLFCKEILEKKLRGKWMDFSSLSTTCTPIMRCVHQGHLIKFIFFRFVVPKDKQNMLSSKAYCSLCQVKCWNALCSPCVFLPACKS